MPKAGNLGIDPTSGYLRLRQSSHVAGPGGADRGRSEFIPHPMFDLSEVGLEAEVSQPGRQVSPIVPYIEPVRGIAESVHHQMRVEYSATCLSRVTLRFQ